MGRTLSHTVFDRKVLHNDACALINLKKKSYLQPYLYFTCIFKVYV